MMHSLSEQLTCCSWYRSRTGQRVLLLTLILVALATRFGHFMIIDPGALTGMGGLFAEFGRQIHLNGYAIPEAIPYYSEDGIPFLYPPLAFYLLAIAVFDFGIDRFLFLNLAPPLFSLISLYLFYQFARAVFDGGSGLALVATLLFALAPNTLVEQLPPEGLAESLGTLMLTGLLLALHRLQAKPSLGRAIVAGLMFGLCVFSSPGSALASTLIVLAFVPFVLAVHRAQLNDMLRLLVVAALAFLLMVSPYLLHLLPKTVIAFEALSAQSGRPLREYIGFIESPHVSGKIIAWDLLFILGGIYALLIKGYRVFPLLAIGVYLLMPREGHWAVSPLVAIVATIGLVGLSASFEQVAKRSFGKARTGRFFSFVLIGYLVVLSAAFTPARTLLDADSVHGKAVRHWPVVAEVFDWMEANLNQDVQVVFVGNQTLREWAPHLTQRTVLNVPEGTEFDLKDRQLQPGYCDPALELHECVPTVDWLAALASLFASRGPVVLVVDESSLPRMYSTEVADGMNPLLERAPYRVFLPHAHGE